MRWFGSKANQVERRKAEDAVQRCDANFLSLRLAVTEDFLAISTANARRTGDLLDQARAENVALKSEIDGLRRRLTALEPTPAPPPPSITCPVCGEPIEPYADDRDPQSDRHHDDRVGADGRRLCPHAVRKVVAR